jgi:hypothetical protein
MKGNSKYKEIAQKYDVQRNRAIKIKLLYIHSTELTLWQLSVQCILQKTQNLNGCPLLCMFLAGNFS